ncbi:hypothetical protein RRG08_054323 [Elysia crispata]|uniref:Uncharacterized protein n=1 Tax=Elysia crispata TaxID=231223 RepID=A0AAE1B3J0_9GAST|nr:hypothetical protein RRG08_054323 [Elysia crispata]
MALRPFVPRTDRGQTAEQKVLIISSHSTNKLWPHDKMSQDSESSSGTQSSGRIVVCSGNLPTWLTADAYGEDRIVHIALRHGNSSKCKFGLCSCHKRLKKM